MRFFSIFFLIICLSSCDKKNSTSSNQNLDALDNDSISISEKYYKEGLEYYENGDLEKAKESYKLAIDKCESKDANTQFEYYIKLITLYIFENEYGNALASLNEYEEKLLIPELQKQLLVKDTEQYIFIESGHIEKAIEVNNIYYDLAQSTHDTLRITNALIFRSELLDRKGQFEESKKILESLIKSDYLSPLTKNTVQLKLAIQNYYKGNFEEAIQSYKVSLEFHKRSNLEGEINGIAVQYANIAEAYIELNKLKEAKIYLDSFKSADQNKINNNYRRSVFKYEVRLLKALNADNKSIESLIDEITLDQEKFYSERYNKDLEYLSEEKEKSEKLLIEKQLAELDRLTLRNNFILLASILIIGLLVALFVVFKQRRDNEIKDLRGQQRLLRAQMNPHFIFNILSSIQNLVRKDSKEASRFITKFSRLLRKVLENSMRNYVLVTEEVEVLTNYLELQKLRFPELFSYDFQIDDRLVDELVSIPPMLIQPFVENAIEHGFKGINYKGEIKIELIFRTEKKEFLSCFISDNGKGYTHENNEDKKSASVQLISDFIKKSTGSSIETNYLDLDQKTGTLITFQIPIQ